MPHRNISISNPKNKQNLAAFLCESLRKNIPARLGPLQKVVLGGGFKDGFKAVCLTHCSAGHRSTASDLAQQLRNNELDTLGLR